MGLAGVWGGGGGLMCLVFTTGCCLGLLCGGAAEACGNSCSLWSS